VSWDDDPAWAAARARTREEVQAALAARPVTCEECGHETVTASRTCPACGHPYVATREPVLTKRGRRRLLGGLLVAAAVLGLLAALIVPRLQDSTSEANAKQDAERARVLARTRAEITVDQKLHAAAAPAAHTSAAAATALEAAVTRDARARVKSGALKGPIERTDCEPYKPNPRTGPTLRFQCTAVSVVINRDGKAAGVLGYPFWAKADIGRGRLYWCKVNPKPGEKATNEGQLDVPLDPRCNLSV
jgi:type II secretory pathway pseudopilin PulG